MRTAVIAMLAAAPRVVHCFLPPSFVPRCGAACARRVSRSGQWLQAAPVEVGDALPPAAKRVLHSLASSITAEQQLLLETYIQSIFVQAASDLTVAHKDLTEAHKDLELAHKDLELAGKDLELAGKDLKSANAQLMRLQGLLHMRGILEYVEQKFKEDENISGRSRTYIWTELLKKSPKLAACVRRTTGWDTVNRPDKTAERIASLYDTLNKHSHMANTPEEWALRDAIVISDAHQASLLDCKVLVCICEHYKIPYELRLSRSDFGGAAETPEAAEED